MNQEGAHTSPKLFRELVLRFRQEEIACGEPDQQSMPILLDNEQIGQITAAGIFLIDRSTAEDEAASNLCDRVGRITGEALRSIRLWEKASLLNAAGLSVPYKLLAEFDGGVLGAMDSQFGIQLTAWSRTYDQTGVTTGHYFGNDIAGALRDFAVRANLISGKCLFSPEQLAEAYRSVKETLDHASTLTEEWQKRLESFAEQIGDGIPTLSALVEQSNQMELNMDMEM